MPVSHKRINSVSSQASSGYPWNPETDEPVDLFRHPDQATTFGQDPTTAAIRRNHYSDFVRRARDPTYHQRREGEVRHRRTHHRRLSTAAKKETEERKVSCAKQNSERRAKALVALNVSERKTPMPEKEWQEAIDKAPSRLPGSRHNKRKSPKKEKSKTRSGQTENASKSTVSAGNLGPVSGASTAAASSLSRTVPNSLSAATRASSESLRSHLHAQALREFRRAFKEYLAFRYKWNAAPNAGCRWLQLPAAARLEFLREEKKRRHRYKFSPYMISTLRHRRQKYYESMDSARRAHRALYFWHEPLKGPTPPTSSLFTTTQLSPTKKSAKPEAETKTVEMAAEKLREHIAHIEAELARHKENKKPGTSESESPTTASVAATKLSVIDSPKTPSVVAGAPRLIPPTQKPAEVRPSTLPSKRKILPKERPLYPGILSPPGKRIRTANPVNLGYRQGMRKTSVNATVLFAPAPQATAATSPATPSSTSTTPTAPAPTQMATPASGNEKRRPMLLTGTQPYPGQVPFRPPGTGLSSIIEKMTRSPYASTPPGPARYQETGRIPLAWQNPRKVAHVVPKRIVQLHRAGVLVQSQSNPTALYGTQPRAQRRPPASGKVKFSASQFIKESLIAFTPEARIARPFRQSLDGWRLPPPHIQEVVILNRETLVPKSRKKGLPSEASTNGRLTASESRAIIGNQPSVQAPVSGGTSIPREEASCPDGSGPLGAQPLASAGMSSLSPSATTSAPQTETQGPIDALTLSMAAIHLSIPPTWADIPTTVSTISNIMTAPVVTPAAAATPSASAREPTPQTVSRIHHNASSSAPATLASMALISIATPAVPLTTPLTATHTTTAVPPTTLRPAILRIQSRYGLRTSAAPNV
ncbi:hypothetical protein B0T19DRAFT_462749 [Cercophora scortea]|uniref:Uncharacterized protein n=1 Tax=Cercophora scortea TaxID=314031 RepID=A0AAE0IDV4_9PEZI|nr:hypothetical protein B0T19DRAFT_462749 [Cercophora scortea]